MTAKKKHVAKQKSVSRPVVKAKPAVLQPPVYKRPLPMSFSVVGLLGIIVFGFYLATGQIDPTWGIALLLFFLVLFVASLLSLEPEPR